MEVLSLLAIKSLDGGSGPVTDPTVISVSSSLPTPSAQYLGKAWLYTGTTTSQYTYGHIYRCAQQGSDYVYIDINPILGTEQINYQSLTIEGTTGLYCVKTFTDGSHTVQEATLTTDTSIVYRKYDNSDWSQSYSVWHS